MQAIYIQPERKLIELIQIDLYEDIKKCIGSDTIVSTQVSKSGDRIFFDEHAHTRYAMASFQIDALDPIVGNAIIVLAAIDGNDLRDVVCDLDAVKQYTTFL